MTRLLTLFFALFAMAFMAFAAPTKTGRIAVNGNPGSLESNPCCGKYPSRALR